MMKLSIVYGKVRFMMSVVMQWKYSRDGRDWKVVIMVGQNLETLLRMQVGDIQNGQLYVMFDISESQEIAQLLK